MSKGLAIGNLLKLYYQGAVIFGDKKTALSYVPFILFIVMSLLLNQIHAFYHVTNLIDKSKFKKKEDHMRELKEKEKK